MVGNKVEAERKLQEMAMAKRLEQEMGKDEILNLYLNTVYFGQGAYGVQAAAEVYWGLDAADLGWGEAALLAALISNPSGYDPIYKPFGGPAPAAHRAEPTGRAGLHHRGAGRPVPPPAAAHRD